MADHGATGHPAATPAPLPQRGRFAGSGFVERVRILPRSSAPQFDATVALHTQRATSPAAEAKQPGRRIRLVWIGQRRIPGIDPGVDLAFEGMVSVIDGIPTIHNPRYEIVGRPEESP
ncbi:hypothetical protein [Arthrobacter tumbae]|uniref:hypothetical protein n=1 Tax=Arthrobacter tumbae TaxID=163874 RepID=UPI001EF99350|nr:hypothetical protein [Arthrobacter tumbae]MBM7782916.1 hypothetical protein [Arthrobacter tumbae]